MNVLLTKNKSFPVLKTGKDCIAFFNSAKTTRTVDIMTEGVLRFNLIEVNLANWEIAYADASDKDLPTIVKVFIQAASQKWLDLKTQR